jgi:hypothetical protein
LSIAPALTEVSLDTRTTERALGRVALAVAIAVAVLFLIAAAHYVAGAHMGVDQNGYLVGGKMLAETGSMGLKPDDPFAFVGRMWIGTEDGWFYPKYPIGLPFLYAVVMWIGPQAWVYYVSPICMSAGLVAVYLLGRELMGWFAGLLALVIVASSPATLGLAANPNSHASTFFCVAWGMYLLLRWWQTGGAWRAAAAGFLLGYAVTIRYSEGLLLLPMALAALMRCAKRGPAGPAEGVGSWRDWLKQSAALVGGWAVPVGLLVTYNLLSFGDLTGYDSTNESTGFRWEYFQENIETMVRTLAAAGMIFVLPFSVAGLCWLWVTRWRVAAFLTAWALPSILLYTAYYWAPDNLGLGYLRFFLTVLPPLAVGAVVFANAIPLSPLRLRLAGLAATVLIVGIAGAMGIVTITPTMENEHRNNLVIATAVDRLKSMLPEDAVVFSEDRVLHHLQFVGRQQLYSVQPVDRGLLRRLENLDPDEPQGLQPQRLAMLGKLLEGKSDAEIARLQTDIATSAIDKGRRVFVIAQQRQVDTIRRQVLPAKLFDLRRLPDGRWSDLPATTPAQRRGGRRSRPETRTVWNVYEVVKKLPATAPSSRPATRAAK